MSNIINYKVSYDSDYLMPDRVTVNSSATVLTNVTNIEFSRDIAPSEDNATLTLGGIGYTGSDGFQHAIDSAREIYIYRVNSDGTYTLKFRGMTTNPVYDGSDAELVTTVQVNSLWYLLATRLFQIAGKSPPPLQPNTNPYLVYLNPTLGLNFGQLWTDIIVTAFQQSYSTGHLPVFHLPNLATNGAMNPSIMGLTDFDKIVVNDNLNLQYQSVDATINRLVTSALFNSSASSPFLAEYRMDIGDYPYGAPTGTWTGTVPPLLPTATVMLFDPVHSKLGNGNNRTGLVMGDNSIDPAGTLPADLYNPMSYVEFGVTNGYLPIDTLIFSEGDSIVTWKLTYDYISMNNSYVLTGGSFQGSDVVALPIDNQRSIAEYGLKQTSQPLQNVVDQGEIKRFVGTSINFFQHPIPNIVVKPDYVYASTHVLYPGDYVLLNIPSLAGVIEDSNGVKLPTGAFTARIRTIDISWNPNDGEDITLTFSFPITNVPIDLWNAVNNSQTVGSPAGAMQFMYTTVNPSSKTLIGRMRQNEGAANYGAGGDFITNKSNPVTDRLKDDSYSNIGGITIVVPFASFLELPIYAQHIPNNMDAILAPYSTCTGTASSYTVTVTPSLSPWVVGCNIIIAQGTGIEEPNIVTAVSDDQTTLTLQNALTYTHTSDPIVGIESVKGDDIQIYQFGVEVDTPNTAPSDTTTAPSDVYLTVLQPDGMAIFDTIVNLNQLTNILALISKSHQSPASAGDSAPLLTDSKGNVNLSGRYQVIIRNVSAFPWCSDPLFQTFASPIFTMTSSVPSSPEGWSFIVTAVDAIGNEFAMSGWTYTGLMTPAIVTATLAWNPVVGAVSYNLYFQPTKAGAPPLGRYLNDMFGYVQFVTGWPSTSYPLNNGTTWPPTPVVPETMPYPPLLQPTGVDALNTSTSTPSGILVDSVTYWYLVTANTIAGNETDYSAASPIVATTLLGHPQPQSIFVSWPVVPNAQSYNVYRSIAMTTGFAEGFMTYTYPSGFDLLASQVSETYFTDDGSYDFPSSPTLPPKFSETTVGDNVYTLYANHSLLQDPAHTQSVSTGGTNNPSTAIVYNPTIKWVYPTHQYVAP